MLQLMNYLIPFFGALAYRLPRFLVWAIALYFALSRWEKHPNVSKLTAIASLLLILLEILESVLGFLPLFFINRGWSTARMTIALSIGNLLISLLFAIPWMLILNAIFGWRREGSG